MLSAQLSSQFQPVVEEIMTGLDDLQVLERDVLLALGLIIAVDLLQTLVKHGSKLLKVVRTL